MINRILFGIIAAALLIGISYFTSKIFAIGFRFNEIQTRAGLFGFLLISLLFIGILIVRRTTILGSFPYTIIQILAGIGLYLFIGAIVLALILGIGAIAHISIPVGLVWVVLGASLGLAVIGFAQRYSIAIRTISVTLPDAPVQWNNKKAVLVSDTHFGLVNATRFSDNIVQKILAQHPDFVLHAGDFYDGPTIATEPITDSWKVLTSSVPVFYAPGNHELYGDYTAFIDSIKAAGITVLDDKKTEYDGVQIAGITYRSGTDDPAAATAIASLNLDRVLPVIVINHPPTSLAAAQAAGVDLQVSGHTHNGQFWPMNYLIKNIYGAFAHGVAPYKGMTVITTSGVGTFGPPFRTFNRPELIVITFKTQ